MTSQKGGLGGRAQDDAAPEGEQKRKDEPCAAAAVDLQYTLREFRVENEILYAPGN